VGTDSRFLDMGRKSYEKRGRRDLDLNIPADSCCNYGLGSMVGHPAGTHTLDGTLEEAVEDLDSVQLAHARRTR
jgi:hypothetical protein